MLNKHTKSIINQMLKDPILQAKEMAAQADADKALDLFVKIFNIEDLVAEHDDEVKAAEPMRAAVKPAVPSFQS
ncbi:Glutamyl-tRNA reductase [Mycobacteroides abscessus subsp. abscessus]|nr:Glutamyl-tRNA reductase [Mycobacteroides abscessus subsp. abscessus]